MMVIVVGDVGGRDWEEWTRGSAISLVHRVAGDGQEGEDGRGGNPHCSFVGVLFCEKWQMQHIHLVSSRFICIGIFQIFGGLGL